jgi:hypothetical protein
MYFVNTQTVSEMYFARTETIVSIKSDKKGILRVLKTYLKRQFARTQIVFGESLEGFRGAPFSTYPNTNCFVPKNSSYR